jgi:hypothetical protein
VFKELRATRLIGTEGRTLTVRDWDGLVALGEFDPEYLHLRTAPM